jgi:hypothetical protein
MMKSGAQITNEFFMPIFSPLLYAAFQRAHGPFTAGCKNPVRHSIIGNLSRGALMETSEIIRLSRH